MSYINYKWFSSAGITAFRSDGSAVFIEPGHDDWDSAYEEAGPYIPPPPPSFEEVKEEQRRRAIINRQSAFQKESDPLFFKWQSNEGSKEEWLAKREEIRNRYPYPNE